MGLRHKHLRTGVVLTDDSPMPFGKHEGERMEDVPAKYLVWLYNDGLKEGPVRRYIEDNLKVLEQEIEEQGN